MLQQLPMSPTIPETTQAIITTIRMKKLNSREGMITYY